MFENIPNYSKSKTIVLGIKYFNYLSKYAQTPNRKNLLFLYKLLRLLND